jgi:hypothetical protein
MRSRQNPLGRRLFGEKKRGYSRILRRLVASAIPTSTHSKITILLG